MIESFMPDGDLRTRYALAIDARPERVYLAARETPMMGGAVSRGLLWLRALPARFDPLGSPEGVSTFIVLGEVPNREVVFGVAGHFWHPSRNIVPLTGVADWKRYVELGGAKAAMNFVVELLPGGHTRLSTETRVQCFGEKATRAFKRYWAVMGPFSGLIRWTWLRDVRRKSRR